jgi:hypothetical protein
VRAAALGFAKVMSGVDPGVKMVIVRRSVTLFVRPTVVTVPAPIALLNPVSERVETELSALTRGKATMPGLAKFMKASPVSVTGMLVGTAVLPVLLPLTVRAGMVASEKVLAVRARPLPAA